MAILKKKDIKEGAGAKPAAKKNSKPEKTSAPLEEKHPQATAGVSSQLSRRDVTSEEIARRAYELWQQRGSPHGSDADDWHRAERELRGRNGS
jgi:hypothetical protein